MLRVDQNCAPEEEDLEALSRFLTTIGPFCMHSLAGYFVFLEIAFADGSLPGKELESKNKPSMDHVFDIIAKLSTDKRLTSRIRFMLMVRDRLLDCATTHSLFCYSILHLFLRVCISVHSFLLQDLIDLRANKWIARRAESGPKSLAELHEEVHTPHFQFFFFLLSFPRMDLVGRNSFLIELAAGR
jgi:hypothetical protein